MATTTAKKKPVKKTTAKSAKKPATKVAKKTTAKSAKTASKTVSKKVSSTKTKTEKVNKPVKEVKSTLVNKKRDASPFDKLRALHFSNFFIGAILSALALFMLEAFKKDIFVGYQAKDIFVNSNEVNLVPANEVLFSMDLRYMLVAALGVTALVSLLIATKLYKRYEVGVKAGISSLRWLLFGVASMFLFSFVALNAGVQDVSTLKTISGLVILGSVLGWLSERENFASKSPRRVAFFASVFAYLMALLPIAISLVTTSLFSAERFSWFVYALAAVLGLSVFAVLMNLRASMVNKKNLAYIAYEQRFVRIDQITKLLIVLIIFSVFNK